MTIIYADNNATTAVAPEVRQAMAPFLAENYFNPSSMYAPALAVAAAVAEARATVARSFGLDDPKQILFTSCATGEQQHGDPRRRQGEPQPPPRHHHRRGTPGGPGSLQGPRAQRL